MRLRKSVMTNCQPRPYGGAPVLIRNRQTLGLSVIVVASTYHKIKKKP